jgi:hypothetical protein
MAASDGDRDLIVVVSRDLVATVAPEEVALFRSVSTAYFDAPERLRRVPKDDMLGFGVGDVVVALTPIVLSVMTEVLAYLRHEVAQTASKDVAGALDHSVRGLFRRFHHGDQAPAAAGLTQEQLAEVGRLAFEKARAMRVPEGRARLLADALVGSLVLRT